MPSTLAARDGSAGRSPGCRSPGTLRACAAPGAVEQLGEVDGFAAAGVELVDLGAAGEPVGEHDGVRVGRAQRG